MRHNAFIFLTINAAAVFIAVVDTAILHLFAYLLGASISIVQSAIFACGIFLLAFLLLSLVAIGTQKKNTF